MKELILGVIISIMKYYELMHLTRQLILLGECVFANLKLRNTYNVIRAGNMPFWHRVPKMKYSLTHVMDINSGSSTFRGRL